MSGWNDTPIRNVMYKGKPYSLLWMGETKHGHRAKLRRHEWEDEFWVDAAAVRELRQTPSVCPVCGASSSCCNGAKGEECQFGPEED